MIRIEGIPIVAARLANAAKVKPAQPSDVRRKKSKIATVKAPVAARSQKKVA